MLIRDGFGRACVGKNLAMLELQMTVASIMRRYDIVLENPGEPVRVQFLLNPICVCVATNVGTVLAGNEGRLPEETFGM